MGNSIPCKIVTPKNFILKLCTRNYVGEVTRHTNFGFNRYSGGFSPNRRNITTLWLFWLYCPVLYCPYLFFSILRPGRTAGPIFTLYGSNDVFPRKEVNFGVGIRMMGDVIWGKYTPKTPQKWAWIGNFKPKRQNIKITISPNLWIRSRPNLRTNLRPTIALRGWSNVVQIKSNMAAGRHLENIDTVS